MTRPILTLCVGPSTSLCLGNSCWSGLCLGSDLWDASSSGSCSGAWWPSWWRGWSACSPAPGPVQETVQLPVRAPSSPHRRLGGSLPCCPRSFWNLQLRGFGLFRASRGQRAVRSRVRSALSFPFWAAGPRTASWPTLRLAFPVLFSFSLFGSECFPVTCEFPRPFLGCV